MFLKPNVSQKEWDATVVCCLLSAVCCLLSAVCCLLSALHQSGRCLQALNAIHDQDTFYDMVDALEEQGIASLIRDSLVRPGLDPDLVEQYELYEAVLKQEDGEGVASPASAR